MKTLLSTFLTLFGATLLFAQVPTSETESTDLNVLYLGYKNKVKITAIGNENSVFRVTGTNCTAAPTDTPYEYIVTPSNGDKAILSVHYVGKDGNVTHVEKMEYLIQVLPQVSIYWGSAKAGGKASLSDQKLSVKYAASVPFHANFEIINWDVSSEFGNASGVGASLKSATTLFNKINKTTSISMTIRVKGEDGVIRQLGATWTVEP